MDIYLIKQVLNYMRYALCPMPSRMGRSYVDQENVESA
jgi:hypothetical protein